MKIESKRRHQGRRYFAIKTFDCRSFYSQSNCFCNPDLHTERHTSDELLEIGHFLSLSSSLLSPSRHWFCPPSTLIDEMCPFAGKSRTHVSKKKMRREMRKQHNNGQVEPLTILPAHFERMSFLFGHCDLTMQISVFTINSNVFKRRYAPICACT